MFYTVYQITHIPSGKIYVGKHQTTNLDDGYFGSGKRLKNAIKKHGVEQFKKDILFVFDTEDEMNTKEQELVTEAFCRRKDTYNICEGGTGGFGYINRTGLSNYPGKGENAKRISPKGVKRFRELLETDTEFGERWKQKLSESLKERFRTHQHQWTGRRHSRESRERQSQHRVGKYTGSENSQFGTMWITNGTSTQKIRKTETIPDGWYRGRKISCWDLV